MMTRIFYALSSVLLVTLYFGASDLKYKTQDAREELREVERAIQLEKEEIRVLSAEWSHLTRPDNLRQLAEAHLGLNAVRVEQIAAIEDVPYLGMNLYDQIEEATPINYEAGPRAKPGRLIQQFPAGFTPFDGPIQVAQIELVALEQ